jgi:hypothetical protein
VVADCFVGQSCWPRILGGVDGVRTPSRLMGLTNSIRRIMDMMVWIALKFALNCTKKGPFSYITALAHKLGDLCTKQITIYTAFCVYELIDPLSP